MAEPLSRRGAPGAASRLRLDGRRSRTLILTQWGLRRLVTLVAAGGLDAAGLEHIPEQGPLLLCSNHVSNFDPLLLGATVPRVMHAMAKAELFQNRWLGRYLHSCNCIPVRRDRADAAALRSALAVLQAGGVVVLFPEGHRSHGVAMRSFSRGAGYLAWKSGVQVLPCAIWGTERVLPRGRLLPRRAQVHVRFGPVFLPVGAGPEAVTRDLERRVAALLPADRRPSADPDQGDGEDQGGVDRD
ncbi:MAG: lysophospholipid acyltransferase family protein [Candidatus Dormiibacterota bacterium]